MDAVTIEDWRHEPEGQTKMDVQEAIQTRREIEVCCDRIIKLLDTWQPGDARRDAIMHIRNVQIESSIYYNTEQDMPEPEGTVADQAKAILKGE